MNNSLSFSGRLTVSSLADRKVVLGTFANSPFAGELVADLDNKSAEIVAKGGYSIRGNKLFRNGVAIEENLENTISYLEAQGYWHYEDNIYARGVNDVVTLVDNETMRHERNGVVYEFDAVGQIKRDGIAITGEEYSKDTFTMDLTAVIKHSDELGFMGNL